MARTMSRSWRIESVSRVSAARHWTNFTGMRPASRLAPSPDQRRAEPPAGPIQDQTAEAPQLADERGPRPRADRAVDQQHRVL
jgi:hypothetical protein